MFLSFSEFYLWLICLFFLCSIANMLALGLTLPFTLFKTYVTERPVNAVAMSPLLDHVCILHVDQNKRLICCLYPVHLHFCNSCFVYKPHLRSHLSLFSFKAYGFLTCLVIICSCTCILCYINDNMYILRKLWIFSQCLSLKNEVVIKFDKSLKNY